MIVVYATDLSMNVRRPWALDFRTIERFAFGVGEKLPGVTDCLWIAPGSFDFDA